MTKSKSDPEQFRHHSLEEIQEWFEELLEGVSAIPIRRVDTGGFAIGTIDPITGISRSSYSPFLVNRYDEVEARAWMTDAGAALSAAFPHEGHPTRQEWNHIRQQSGSKINEHFDALVGVFKGAANQVKSGRIPYRNAAPASEGPPMSYSTLADVILRGLFKDGRVSNIWEIAEAAGCRDIEQAAQVAEELGREGLVTQLAAFPEGVWGRISSKGARLVEGVGGDVNAMEHFSKIDNKGGLTINGHVIDTNLAFLSPGANQNNGRGGDYASHLAAMAVSVKTDGSLGEDQIQDALVDIATLKLQLNKATPNKTLVRSLLDNLGTIGSLGGLVSEAIKAWKV
jgi:hypothetical protein